MRVYVAGPPFAEEDRRGAESLLRAAGRDPVGRTPPHPWVVYVSRSVHGGLSDAVSAVAAQPDPRN